MKTLKLNFDDALESISDGRYVKYSDIQAAALNRVVWCADWHLPGCLSESQSYSTTKKDAVSAACSMAENEDGIPRGMKTSLLRYGRFDCHTELFGTVINTVYKMRLSDLLYGAENENSH